MHTFVMKHELNVEHYTYRQFMVDIGQRKDKGVDAIIIIYGNDEENEAEWKGLTQTMKKIIVNLLDERKEQTTKQFNQTNEEV